VRVELFGESWGSQRRCATLLEINLLRSPSSKANINVFIAPQEGVKRNYISQQAVSITRPELFQLRYRLLVAYIYKMSGSVGSRAAIGNAICHKIGFPPQLQSTWAKVNPRHSLNEGLKLRRARCKPPPHNFSFASNIASCTATTGLEFLPHKTRQVHTVQFYILASIFI